MSHTNSNTCFFIVNPRAGSGKTMSKWVPAEKLLAKLGVPFVTALTNHPHHATTLAKEAAAEGFRKIFAVGGDGSLHEVFNGICKYCLETATPTEEFYLGVVPIGSGNDWIKSLDIPNDTEDVIHIIKKDHYTTIDVMQAKMNSSKISFMANIGGIGFDSHVCSRVNFQKESGKRGKMIYINALRYTVFKFKPINISIVADGNVVYSGDCLNIAFGNGRYSGGGMKQVPLAMLDDGMIDYSIVPKAPISKLIKQLPRLFNGSFHNSEYVISGRCKSIQVIPNDDKSVDIVELDGEIEGTLPLSIEFTGHKINVLKAE